MAKNIAHVVRNELIAERQNRKKWINEKLQSLEEINLVDAEKQKLRGYLLDIQEDLEYRNPGELIF